MAKKLNSYDLSRMWFNFCLDNPEKINPKHTAIYFYAIERCNCLGWKKKFGFPSHYAMEIIGIKKHQTYIKAFRDIVEWGFFELIQESKNQHTANIISLNTALPKKDKAKESEKPVCPAEKGQSENDEPCQKTAEQGAKQSGGAGQKRFTKKRQSKGHINKPVKTKKTSQKEKLIKKIKEFGWLADFEKVFKNIPFKAIKCFWENKLSEEIEIISPKQRGGNITNRIKAEAVEFYEEFTEKARAEAEAGEVAAEKGELLIKGASIWSPKSIEEKTELFEEMKKETGLCGKISEAGEISNPIIEEKIFFQLAVDSKQ